MIRRGLTLFLKAEAVALCLIRKWWRPATCLWISLSLLVNGVYLPLKNGQPVDMVALAALVTAATAAFAVREVGKKWGTADDTVPAIQEG